MRFDSNQAWKDAVQAVAANRDPLLALAGVFFMLPQLLFSLFFPQPEPLPGATPDQITAQLSDYFSGAAPAMVVMAVVQMLGTLTVLTLFTDKARPTVGDAIRQGASSIIPAFLAQLLFGFALALAVIVLVGIAVASGVTAIAALAVMFGLVLFVYVSIRLGLIAPVVVVEQLRNPVAILRRSWDLTRGNVGRLLLFFILLTLVFVVVTVVVMGLIGVVLALLLGGESARFVAALVSSAMVGVATLYFIAIIASVHRQLAGPSAEAAAQPFA